MSEPREPYNVNGSQTSRPDFSKLSTEAISWEMLNAMDDRAMIEVYRLLVKLGQRDAAAMLAEYARRIAQIDVTKAE